MKTLVATLLLFVGAAQAEPPGDFYVVKLRGAAVAAFGTHKEARDFISENTVNGRPKGSIGSQRFTIESNAPDLKDQWYRHKKSD